MTCAGCGAVVHCMEIIPCGSLIFLFLLVVYLISVFTSTSVETGFTLEWRFWCVVFKPFVIIQKCKLNLLDFYLFVVLLPPAPQGSLFGVI